MRAELPKVDFFVSMEWDLKSSFIKKNRFFTPMNGQDKTVGLKALKDLYDKNHFSNKSANRAPVIPKIVHQIWIGPHAPPAIFELSQRSIKQLHPGWEYRLWTDADVASLELYNKKVYDLSNNYGKKADILRYEILKKYGGVYIDVDVVCLKPLDQLLHYDLWVGIAPLECHALINTALIGAVPGNPIIEDCIMTLEEDWYAFNTMPFPGNVLYGAGPCHFSKSFMKFVSDETMHTIAFPASYFYPLDLLHRSLAQEASPVISAKVRSYIKDESFAVHYWKGSWWPTA